MRKIFFVKVANKKMFFSGPQKDLRDIIIFLVVILVTVLIISIKTKKFLLGFFLLSLFSNVVFYYGMYYQFAQVYNIMNFFEFTQNIWPYINIALFILVIIFYITKYYVKKTKNK